MSGVHFITCKDFGIGKVRAVHGSTMEVEYFDSVARQVVESIPVEDTREATLSVQTRCYWLAEGHWCVGRVQEALPGAYSVVFHQQARVVPQADLFVRWSKPLEDPTEVLVARACESPRFHASRRPYVESLVRQRAASRGLAGVLSSRVELHQHQVEIARRILEDPVPRYLLADEVGLGKTIEAGFVLRQFFLDNPTGRALIVVPPFLVEQWREELATKFALDDFPRGTVRITSHLDDEKWAHEPFDIVVVDEAHNVAERSRSPEAHERRRYQRMIDIARRTPRLLLLSATPLVHNEETFLAMLHILDPESYRLDGIDDFQAMIAARAEVGRILLGLTEATPPFLVSDFAEELRRLFPRDQRLGQLLDELDQVLAREDAADGEPSEGEDEASEGSSIARCIRAVRVHVSETHRIYRRLLRTRRGPALEESFPVRGRSKPLELVVDDADSRFADVWLDRWRDASRLAIALEPDAEARHAYERVLAGVFQVLLERALSSLAALAVAVASRRRVPQLGDSVRDLMPAEIRALSAASPFEHEDELLDELLEREAASSGDARVEAIANAVKGLTVREKVIVFTSYRSTAEAVCTRLRALLGPDAVARHLEGADPTSTENEIATFRSNDRCRVLVCDRSAEEGRNFQFAQQLIHYDLPWSPNRLEQRLGRMDRFGVGGTVRSIVFVDEPGGESLHGDWYACLASAFSIFERSIAAYQFAVDLLMPAIEADVFEYGGAAIAKRAPWVEQRLAGEGRAIAEQDVLDSIEAVDRKDAFFEELLEMDEDYEGLRDDFERWATRGSRVGYADLNFRCYVDRHNQRIFTLGAQQRTLVPRDWLLRLFGGQHELRGTFARTTAIHNANVRLFRVGLPLYDGISEFSAWDDRGRVFALWRYCRSFAGRDPVGAFRFDYVIEADVSPACGVVRADNRGTASALQRQLDGLLPPRVRTIWMDASGEPITDRERLDELEAPYDQSQGDTNIRSDRFAPVDAIFGQARWESLCRGMRRRSEEALCRGEEFQVYVRERLATARRTLHGRLEILRSRAGKPNATFAAAVEADHEERLVKALLAGIAEPRVRLESLGFVVLAGTPLDV
ncbi:protein DpdE [Sorangium sp. So ce134]